MECWVNPEREAEQNGVLCEHSEGSLASAV